MSVKERIKLFAKSKNISIREFERVTGLNYGYVNAIRVSMQPDKIEGIASHFKDLNVEWLLTGKGEMLINEETESSTSFDGNSDTNYMDIIKSQQRTIDTLSQTIASQQRMIEDMYSKKDTADIA